MKKIVRLPEEYTKYPKFHLCEKWLHDHGCYRASVTLYKNIGWDDGEWHSGPNIAPYAVDFEDPKDATLFALWIGLGIE